MSDLHEPALLLLAHGSPDPRHRAAMQQLTQRVRRRSRSPVALGFLDHDHPTIGEAAATLRMHRCRVAAVSLLLARGFHARFDVPRELAASGVEDAGPVGLHGPVVDAAAQVLDAAHVDRHEPDVAVLLAVAGSGESTAHDDYRAVRVALQRRGVADVQFAALTDGVQRLRSDLLTLGRSHATVAVVPTLLAPGVLADRVRAAAADASTDTSARLVVTRELGTAPAIVTAVLTRAAAAGDVPRSARARSLARG